MELPPETNNFFFGGTIRNKVSVLLGLECPVPGPLFLQVDVMGAHEKLGLVIILERSPIAADDPIMGNHGLEDATIVMRLVTIIGRQHDVTALVTDEVLVVGRYQQVTSLAKTA